MTEWNNRRARLNHDLLKNQLLQSLLRFRRVCNGLIEGEGLVDECQSQVERSLSMVVEESDSILATASQYCGPREWFERPPLNRLPTEDRSWMLAVLQDDWHGFSGFYASLEEAQSLLAEMRVQGRSLSTAADAIQHVRGAGQSHGMQPGMAETAAVLYEKCRAFSSVLTALDFSDALRTFARMDRKGQS